MNKEISVTGHCTASRRPLLMPLQVSWLKHKVMSAHRGPVWAPVSLWIKQVWLGGKLPEKFKSCISEWWG